MAEAMTLFLFKGGRQLYEKFVETLTSKRVFIGFPNGLKCLEPT